ncbi:hypothetical protein [Cellulosimicrobium sp. Marseille-Q8652]
MFRMLKSEGRRRMIDLITTGIGLVADAITISTALGVSAAPSQGLTLEPSA